MRPIVIFLATIALFFGSIGVSSAYLSNYSEDVVRDARDTADTSDDLFWFKDLTALANVTYSEQMLKIEELNNTHNGPWDTWEMASKRQIEALWEYTYEELSAVFSRTGGLKYAGWYCAGRYDEKPKGHVLFTLNHYHYIATIGTECD